MRTGTVVLLVVVIAIVVGVVGMFAAGVVEVGESDVGMPTLEFNQDEAEQKLDEAGDQINDAADDVQEAVEDSVDQGQEAVDEAMDEDSDIQQPTEPQTDNGGNQPLSPLENPGQ